MPYELPPDPATEGRDRITRWLGFAFAAILTALLAYFGYVGYETSRQMTDSPTDSADCRTPAALGWEYEAINYDIATDAQVAAHADPTRCPTQGARPGGGVVGPGGVRLAGWYVPSASGSGPAGPTVVLAHGWSSNKSAMLERASLLHEAYNLVLFDFRNHGQSERSDTTQGVREAADLAAVVDWLEAAKAPDRIALLGVSMGGASALNMADDDERIDAVIIESTHATLANAIEVRMALEGYPLALPGSWAALMGALIRTGEDFSAADPVQAIARLDGRPALIISGGRDTSIGADDADDLLAAAVAAGSPAELHVCAEATHAASPETCPEEYRSWVLGFLERVVPPAG
jgi:uncharacterized protein